MIESLELLGEAEREIEDGARLTWVSGCGNIITPEKDMPRLATEFLSPRSCIILMFYSPMFP